MKRIDELRQRLDALLDDFSDMPYDEIADELEFRASEYQMKASRDACRN